MTDMVLIFDSQLFPSSITMEDVLPEDKESIKPVTALTLIPELGGLSH